MVDRENTTPTLPNELLSLIFREYVFENSGLLQPERTTRPLQLSWVNRQWRAVSLSMPELWTSIILPNTRARRTTSNPDPTNGDYELLKLYVARSGDLPFSFALDYGGIETDGSQVDEEEDPDLDKHISGMHQLTLVLDTVRHRWRVAVVRCRILDALGILSSSLTLGAPLLENLLIAAPRLAHKTTGPESEAEHPRRMLDLARCPKVSRIVLQCPELRVNPFLPEDSSLENLASLSINGTNSQPDAFTWLQCSPNLRSLTIRFIDAPAFALPYGRPVALENLTQFTLGCFSGVEQERSDPSSFFHLLRLPVLRSFGLNMDGSMGPARGWPHVSELLQRSTPGPELRIGPPIEELELFGTPLSVSDLFEILNLTPEVKKLSIDRALTSDQVLERLGGINSSRSNADADALPNRTPLCPLLETLVLHACLASLPTLASMASARVRRACASFRSTTSEKDNEPYEHRALAQEQYRTLKILDLEHSYSYLPPISMHAMFGRCQEDGLEIRQRPSPLFQNLGNADSRVM